MSIKSLAGVLAGFLGHYAQEAATLHSAFTSILSTLPIEPGEKAHIQEKLDGLIKAADNITAALGHGLPEETPVQISEKDIEAALANVIPGLLVQYFAEHPPVRPTAGGEG